MNSEFLSGVWRDPLLHIQLLEQLETYPPFGAVREINIENVTAVLNRSLTRDGKAPLTREAVEERIDRIVATKHDAFANIDQSEFLHPDFVRLRTDAATKEAIGYDAKRALDALASPPSASAAAAAAAASSSSSLAHKNKRARVDDAAAAAAAASPLPVSNGHLGSADGVAAAAAASVSPDDNPADAALAKDANLALRMRRFERAWNRHVGDGEKLKEFAKLVYGALASAETRSCTTAQVVAFVRQNLKKALVPAEVTRFAAKSDDELREVTVKALANNAVFFALGGGGGGDVMAKRWTIGSVAALKLDENNHE